MTDLISRQEAIDSLMKILDRPNHAEFLYTDEICGVLENLPSVEPHWIPCNERLPKVRQWVLCQCRAGIMDVLRLTADGSWDKGYPHTEYMGGFVVAWMPLPKPYEVENEKID